ncbi:hypothetical protein B0H11DRAFT_2223436 [Mycena galericulata]|nr:hypothetical protein B0H11DRAFT_2223436 [Mycena galericulata]
MDPISITTTIITLATFIKDLIEVGQSIKESIEKVSENRRRIRELANDVLRSLADLANLTRGREDVYQAPALLGALGDLKADMLHVLETCRKFSPVGRSPGFRRFGSQLNVWMKRDEIEAEIRRLKEHVINCYIKFTAFSTARTEQRTARIDETTAHIEDISLDHVNTTLRVEQTVVVLLETPFGQSITNQTIDIISADPTHRSLESQYLSVQTMHLIESLQNLMTGGYFIDSNDSVEQHWHLTSLQHSFVPYTSVSHVVHWVLGLVLEFQNSSIGMRMMSVQHLMVRLGAHLANLGMTSEAIAWELLMIQIFKHFAGHGHSAIVLPWLVGLHHGLSRYYQRQLRYDLALHATKQALDIWPFLPDHLRLADGAQSFSMSILVTHSINLRETGQQEIAVTKAQQAVAACRLMVEQTVESASQTSPIPLEVIYNAEMSSTAFFILAKSLSSVDQHVEAYKASKEGFQLVLRFSGSINPPAGEYIDSFIDHICKVAQEDTVSPTMLAEDVTLFRNLRHYYPKNFSSQFLRLLYAYLYISGQNSPPASMKELRIFLEPDSNSLLPVLLHTSSNSTTHLDDFDLYGGVLKDVLQASYVSPWDTRNIHIPLIKIIFITHFNQATAAIQDVISELVADTSAQSQSRLIWALNDLLNDMLPSVHSSSQVVLLNIGLEIIRHLKQTPSLSLPWSLSLAAVLCRSSFGFQIAGLLDEALAAVDEAIELRQSSFDSDNVDEVDELRWSYIRRAFILCDMARVSEAMEAAREASTPLLLPLKELDRKFLCLFQIRILRRTTRHREAQQVLENFMSDRGVTDDTFDPLFIFLLTELAAIRETGYVGQAVHDAEQAVLACRNEVHNTDAEKQKGALVQTLTTLSNRLAADGRHDEALVIAEEATSIYNSNASRMWGAFLNTTRKQELGGNTFHSLSLRLTTSGRLVEALTNAEKATELYRELVSLAPVHRPTLTKSLRNLAMILWKIGRQDESITACEEAVNILREISDNETYFLGALGETLDELAGYLVEKGEVDRASVVTAESAEVRKKIERLPPQPPFLFMEVTLEDAESPTNLEGEAQAVTDEHGQSQPACTNLLLIAAAEPQFEAIDGATSTLDATPPGVSPPGEHEAARAASRKSRLPEVLSTPLEVKLKLSSTPMDILWWILLAALGTAVLWNRM